MRRGIARTSCEAGLDMAAGRTSFTLGKQHRRHEMVEHGLKGLATQALLTQPARLLALVGVEGRRRAANDVLGGGVGHGGNYKRHCERSEASRAAQAV